MTAMPTHLRIADAPPARPASTPAHASTYARDTGIDLVRACCVVVVVLLHALMAGVTLDASGPVFFNAAEGTSWFAPLTWIVQVMPLFFVVGGYAGALAWVRQRKRGTQATHFIASRVHRLLSPAALSIGAAGFGLAALSLMAVDAETVQVAGYRFAQPLWFLGVFLLCQALLPALHAAHRRTPLTTVVMLAAAALSVDVFRVASGVDAIGFANLVFVWLGAQQLGFFLADGSIDAVRRRVRCAALLAAVGVLAVGILTGFYSPDLFENLNPPTTALLLLAAAHTALLSLLRPSLTRLSRRRAATRFTGFVTPRTMTIYLWHMPVLLVMAGSAAWLATATGVALPDPSTQAWWMTRPVWFAGAAMATFVVALVLSPVERRRAPAITASGRRVLSAVMLGLGAVVLLLAMGTNVATALVSTSMLALALTRIREPLAQPIRKSLKNTQWNRRRQTFVSARSSSSSPRPENTVRSAYNANPFA